MSSDDNSKVSLIDDKTLSSKFDVESTSKVSLIEQSMGCAGSIWIAVPVIYLKNVNSNE